MSALITRSLLVCGVLLVFVAPAFAAGEYQQTKNGRTMVWNNNPKPGDEAAWWGDRDREGYASGFGTLTWYTGRKQTAKHLGILPVAKSGVYARYYGNMVRGKFNGPVNVHAKGKTNHAVFIDGVRSSRWAAGRAPSRMPEQNVELAKRAAAEPAAPAEGPKAPPVGKPTKSISKPTEKRSEDDVDESLRELVGSPFFLRAKSNADAPPVDAKKKEAQPSTEARLTKEEVADLADAEARKRGYNPAEYGRAEPKYHLDDRIWSINYERPAPDEMESGKSFSVMIDDKTKGIVFVPGKN